MRATWDGETIQKWADDNGLLPATIDSLSDGPDAVGELTFAEPGGGHGSVRTIDWSEFFERFEDEGLALLIDEDDDPEAPGDPEFRFTRREAAG